MPPKHSIGNPNKIEGFLCIEHSIVKTIGSRLHEPNKIYKKYKNIK
jgi:hypothetical protein